MREMYSETENLNIWQQGYVSTDDEQDDDEGSGEEEESSEDGSPADENDDDDEEYDDEGESEEELDSVIEAELSNKNVSDIEKQFLATQSALEKRILEN